MKVLVLGGQGNFGRRICRRLKQAAGIELLVGGRRRRETGETASPGRWVALDYGDAQFAQQLRDLGPQLLIHCAGPFQGQDYRVAFFFTAAFLFGAVFVAVFFGAGLAFLR